MKKHILLACFVIGGCAWLHAGTKGQCGPNAFWELSDNGVLTISGIGEMQCSNTCYARGFSRGTWCHDGGRDKVQSVVIQYGITKIDHDAFGSLPIKSVSIPESVKEIEEGAFYGCKQLVSLNLPQGIEVIGNRAFQGCESLSKLTLPTSLVRIGDGAFSRCIKLKSVTVPSNVKTLNSRTFADCVELISVSITDGVEALGWNVFAGCESLSYITIPKTIRDIGNQTFEGCARLSNIYVAPGNERYCSIDGVVFDRNNTLTVYPPGKVGDYTTPSETKFIAAKAFADCSGLTSITITNGVKEIGDAAFLRCQSLSSVALPATIEHVGTSAFMNCENLLAIYIPANEEKKFWQMDNLLDFSSKLVARNDIFTGSDVDVNIPVNNDRMTNDKTFAVIIANENYQKESDVPYALNDGRVFAEYCQKTLALPVTNIRLRENATLNNIRQDIQWLQEIARAFDGEAKIIFFYSGHGVPDEKEKNAYLLPIDGDARMAYTGLRMDDLYAALGKYPAQSVTVFLDACFSGRQRDGELLDKTGRGVTVTVKKGQPEGNMVVFSASQGDETAYPYQGQEHGMFTYFLLKGLQESHGAMTYQELSDYVIENVRRQSIVLNGKSQTPSLLVSPTVQQWQSWKFQ